MLFRWTITLTIRVSSSNGVSGLLVLPRHGFEYVVLCALQCMCMYFFPSIRLRDVCDCMNEVHHSLPENPRSPPSLTCPTQTNVLFLQSSFRQSPGHHRQLVFLIPMCLSAVLFLSVCRISSSICFTHFNVFLSTVLFLAVSRTYLCSLGRRSSARLPLLLFQQYLLIRPQGATILMPVELNLEADICPDSLLFIGEAVCEIILSVRYFCWAFEYVNCFKYFFSIFSSVLFVLWWVGAVERWVVGALLVHCDELEALTCHFVGHVHVCPRNLCLYKHKLSFCGSIIMYPLCWSVWFHIFFSCRAHCFPPFVFVDHQKVLRVDKRLFTNERALNTLLQAEWPHRIILHVIGRFRVLVAWSGFFARSFM